MPCENNLQREPVIWYNHSPDDNAAMGHFCIHKEYVNACKMLCQIRQDCWTFFSPYNGTEYKPVTLLDSLILINK